MNMECKKQITLGSLFSGIGGLEIGLEKSIPNLNIKWQVEIDEHATAVLEKHWPNVKRFKDVSKIQSKQLEKVDIICGGFPCTQISKASGKPEGLSGKDSGLWFEMLRIIREIRPKIIIIENVPDWSFHGLSECLSSLAEMRYDAEWRNISCDSTGLPQERERIFVVAYPHGEGPLAIFGSHKNLDTFIQETKNIRKDLAQYRSSWKQVDWHEAQIFNKADASELLGDDYGVYKRPHQERLKMIGNAVSPRVSYIIGDKIYNWIKSYSS